MLETKLINEISTPDLIDELLGRCSPACFIGTREEGMVDGKTAWYKAKGHPAACYGLIHELALELQAEYIKYKLDEDDDE